MFLRYSENDKIIEEKAQTENELLWWDKIEYDDEKNIVKRYSLNYYGEIESFTETQTIEKENSILIKKKTEKGLEKRFIEIIKNKKGDWIIKRVFINGNHHHTTKREIVYY